MKYFIVDIRGEYAYLRPLEVCSASEDLMVAMALLPFNADVGSRIYYEAGEYSLID